MPNPVVFFSRCRPQEADPIDIVLQEGRVFIGYPAWRDGVDKKSYQLREAIVDLNCSDEEWAKVYASFGKGHHQHGQRAQFQKNRNLFRDIVPGSIALVPRPARGVVYAGRVVAPFELLDDPPWAADYLRLREEQGCGEADDEFSHRGDVAQCCTVDRFRPIPFPLVPAWIRRSLFGRSTYGRIWPLTNPAEDPYALLDQLIDNPARPEYGWTLDEGQVERRLVDGVGPNSFEHLCVSLFQLEHPREVWAYVGGSGDGGVDGIGADSEGKVVGLLQCKWSYGGEPIAVADPHSSGSVRQILAALLHPDQFEPPAGVEFWSRSKIASLLVKHAARLSLALSLRVGKP